MANKLLNVRMDQEMIEDLKKVCGELEISVTDAIKLFSNKLIKERALPIEEKKEEENEVFEEVTGDIIKEMFNEMWETGGNQEEYIQLHNELSDILSFYCKEFGNLIDSTTFYQKDENTYVENYDTPFSEMEKTFKEKYEEELKNKILDKITEFYQKYYNQLLIFHEENEKMIEEHQKKMKIVENDKYIDIMENLKNQNPNLYKELLNKYSYDIDYDEVRILKCETYNDAKKKLEELLTPEEIKEYYTFYSEMDNCKTKEEKEKVIENIRKDKDKIQRLKNSIQTLNNYKYEKYSKNNNSEEKGETKDE